MDDEIQQEISRTLGKLSDNLDTFNKAAIKAGLRLNQSNDSLTDIFSNSSSAAKDFYNTFKTVGNTVKSINSTLMALGSSAKELSNSFRNTIRGGFFGDIADDLIESGEHLHDTYRSLIDVGQTFGGDMLNLSKSAAQAGLPLDEFSAAIKKNSTFVAVLSETTHGTSNSFGSLVKSVTNNLKQLNYLGFSLSEIAGLTGDFGEAMRMFNVNAIKNNNDLTHSTDIFAEEVTKAAIVSGKSREQIAKETEAALKNISLSTVDFGNATLAVTTSLTRLNAFSPELAKGFGDVLGNLKSGVSAASTEIGQTFIQAGAPGALAAFADMANKVAKSATPLNYKDIKGFADSLQDYAEQLTVLSHAPGPHQAEAKHLAELAQSMKGLDPKKIEELFASFTKQENVTKFFSDLEASVSKVSNAFNFSLVDSLQHGIKGTNSAFDEFQKQMDTLAGKDGKGPINDLGSTIGNLIPPFVQFGMTLVNDFLKWFNSSETIGAISNFSKKLNDSIPAIEATIHTTIHIVEKVGIALYKTVSFLGGIFDKVSDKIGVIPTAIGAWLTFFLGKKALGSFLDNFLGSFFKTANIKAGVVNVNGGPGLGDFGNKKGGGALGAAEGLAENIGGASGDAVYADLKQYGPREATFIEKNFPTFTKGVRATAAKLPWLETLTGTLKNAIPMVTTLTAAIGETILPLIGGVIAGIAPFLAGVALVLSAGAIVYTAYRRISGAWEDYKEREKQNKELLDASGINEKQLNRINNDPDYRKKIEALPHGADIIAQADNLKKKQRTLINGTKTPTPTIINKTNNGENIDLNEDETKALKQENEDLKKVADYNKITTPLSDDQKKDLNKIMTDLAEQMKMLVAINQQAAAQQIDLAKKQLAATKQNNS